MRALSQSVDVASQAVLRIVFGALLFGLSVYLLVSSWVPDYAAARFRFDYLGLSFIDLPRHVPTLRALLVLTILSSCSVMLGWGFRVGAPLLAFLMSWALLGDPALYSSTFYLLTWIAWLLAVSPAHREYSLDSRHMGPALCGRGPAYSLIGLRVLVWIVYTYAGLAKIDPDWLAGLPIELWLTKRASWPLVGGVLASHWFAMVLSWGGLVFDLGVGTALLFRRTRMVAFVLACGFHVFNAFVFRVFPLPVIMIPLTLLFFEPDWPRRLGPRGRRDSSGTTSTRLAVPRWVRFAAPVFLAFHILFPLRHHLAPGPARWNEVHDLFSWRLRARAKRTKFRIYRFDPMTQERVRIDKQLELSKQERKMMRVYPDLLHQAAITLGEEIRSQEPSAQSVEIRVRMRVGLNGRPLHDLIDRKADLSRIPRGLGTPVFMLPAPD